MHGLINPLRARGQSSETSGLGDAEQRSLLRLTYATTAFTLGFFAVLQTIESNYLLACFELAAACLLLWAARRLARVRNVTLWVYAYLIPLFCFLIYIVIMPGASVTAFVWVYLVTIMSYLLLGRRAGFTLAAPVMLLVALAFLLRYGMPDSPAGWIDLGNALLCGFLVLVFVHLYEGRRAAAHRALQTMAETDALTGVANRGHFQTRLERSILESRRTQAPFVLVVLDVDYFKQVNDRWGHAAGDAALRHICQCLNDRLRVTDFVGRLGGEEFGIVLGNSDIEAAIRLVDELRDRIVNTPLDHAGDRIELSATFGLAQWPVDAESSGGLYRCADRRLYQGKARGRNQLVSRDLSPA